jgi:hypothetical protein
MKILFNAAVLVVTFFVAFLALAGDLQSCTTIKSAKNRLTCFDSYASAQKTEAVEKAFQERKDTETKAEQEKMATVDKTAVLAEVDRFKAKLTENFKDPSSVHFKNVIAYGISKGPIITFMCGQVNAKNSYGAYIGFKRFFMIGLGTTEVEDSKNGYVFDQMWPSTCRGNEVFRQDGQTLSKGE